jgi:hypothetical protein
VRVSGMAQAKRKIRGRSAAWSCTTSPDTPHWSGASLAQAGRAPGLSAEHPICTARDPMTGWHGTISSHLRTMYTPAQESSNA